MKTKNLTRAVICPKCGELTIGIILGVYETEVEFECQKCQQVVIMRKKECGCEDL